MRVYRESLVHIHFSKKAVVNVARVLVDKFEQPLCSRSSLGTSTSNQRHYTRQVPINALTVHMGTRSKMPGQHLSGTQPADALLSSVCGYKMARRVRSNHGPSSTTQIYLLRCRQPGEGVVRLSVAGVESHHFLRR